MRQQFHQTHIQLSFDFTTYNPKDLVRVDGYDIYQMYDFTGQIGVVEHFDRSTGNYAVYFHGKKPYWDGLMILYYHHDQLTKVGRGKASWQYKRNLKKLGGSRV